MEEKPKRRWLRYSIRTLLVAVTIFCVWLGYYARWNFERNSWLDPEYVNALGSGARAFPLGLSIVGARGYNALYFSRTVSDEEFERIVELFPEADIYCSTVSDPYRAHQRQP